VRGDRASDQRGGRGAADDAVGGRPGEPESPVAASTADPFGRLRPHTEAVAGRGAATPRHGDAEGKRALFSAAFDEPEVPPLGAITVHCSGCDTTSVLTPRQALTAALPSLHLPFVRRGHPSWMRCPACGRRTWVRLGLQI